MELHIDKHSTTICPTWQAEDEFPEGRAWPVEKFAVNGVPMHLFAIRVAVRERGDGLRAHDEEFDEELEAIYAMAGDQPLIATDLPDLEGEWVISMHPYSD
jgi:hypothetical protein